MPRLSLTYAPTNRAQCRGCLQIIPKNTLRYSSTSNRRTHHYHPSCFFDKMPVIQKSCPTMKSHGVCAFKTPTDQKHIEDLIKAAATKWKKRFGREISYPKELALLKKNELTASQLDHQMSEEVVAGISGDVWIEILLYLPDPKQILRAARVSTSMYFIVNDDRLWEVLLTRTYPEMQIKSATEDLLKQGSKRTKFVFQKLFAELCVCCNKPSDNMQYLKPIRRSICNDCLSRQSYPPPPSVVRAQQRSHSEPASDTANVPSCEYRLMPKNMTLAHFRLSESEIKQIQGVKAPYQKRKDTLQYLYGYTKRRVERMRTEQLQRALKKFDLLRPVNATLLAKKEEEEGPLLDFIEGLTSLNAAITEYTKVWAVDKETKKKRKRDEASSPTEKESKKVKLE